jgi:hypothetical protein
MWHICEKEDVHTGFWWGDLMEGDSVEVLGVEWRIILKCIFQKQAEKALARLL